MMGDDDKHGPECRDVGCMCGDFDHGERKRSELTEAGQRQLDEMLARYRATQTLSLAVDNTFDASSLSDEQLSKVFAQVALEARKRLRLVSLADAVRTGQTFRRPTWPADFNVGRKRVNVAGRFMDMLLSNQGTVFYPTPEDCCATDYEVVP